MGFSVLPSGFLTALPPPVTVDVTDGELVVPLNAQKKTKKHRFNTGYPTRRRRNGRLTSASR